MPRSTVIIPNVTMKELIPPQAMRAPLRAPMTAPRPTTTAIVRGALSPTFAAKLAPTTEHSAMAEPTERSMAPERITIVMPQETMTSTDAWRPMFRRLLEVKNCGSSRAITAAMIRSAANAVPPKTSLREQQRTSRRCEPVEFDVGHRHAATAVIARSRVSRVMSSRSTSATEAPFAHHEHTIRQAQDFRQIGRHDKASAAGGGVLVKKPIKFGARSHVDPDRRLIDEQKLSGAGKPSAENNLLLISAAESAYLHR